MNLILQLLLIASIAGNLFATPHYGHPQTDVNGLQVAIEKDLVRVDKIVIINCNDPVTVGLCKARIRRFFYNAETNQCEAFDWGGCKANGNNFKRESDCVKACVPQN
jgi:hypothetical protein